MKSTPNRRIAAWSYWVSVKRFWRAGAGQRQANCRILPSDLRRRVSGVAKTIVKGPGANTFYQQLAERTSSTPKWNFHKYQINRDGSEVVAYTSLQSAGQLPFSTRRMAAFLDGEERGNGDRQYAITERWHST
jgi:hypothetical protein